ncbi:hypothetical protein QN277_020086 [Acacia crassicarpa]|uniref:C2H2-type domain-containing protein n=1 Tax=Acacia crassicarpa TaxID=499986 RepID=A0AAE1KCK9_9FABA|nr:hypothetical protein QN277_020086 [Acacia crassicarpa]
MSDDFWISLKRSIHCKPKSSEVHEPEATIQQRIPQKNTNSKDCLQRSGSLIKSLRSSDILSLLTHKVVLDISPCCSSRPLRKGVKSPRESRRPTTTTSKKTHHHVNCNECNISSSNSRLLMQTDSNYNNNCSTLVCTKCGEKLKFVDAVEEHHVSQHSVIELDEEDPTRQIIETICRTTSSTNSQTKKTGQIESVLKVQNTPRTFARFEEYREMIKNNAEKSDKKKQPRCLVDGNELLRFHGTTLTCSLGINGSSSISSSSGLCTSKDCCVCQILRHGSFTISQFHGSFGVLTTPTCDKAFQSIESLDSESQRKSVIVCRVIAGTVRFSSEEEIQESEISGFDSLAEKRNGDSEIEGLYVLDPRAILPCFVLIYKP